MAFVLIFGNEKGGTGKSTMAMHTSISFLRKGYRVGTIDIDARQGTLTRYIQNRSLKKQHNPHFDLPLSDHISVPKSTERTLAESEQDERDRFTNALQKLKGCDVIIVDTPGSDQYMSRFAHSFADILITPLNDSFIDLDLLVRLNSDMTILYPSTYAEMVWEQRKERARHLGRSIEWIVLRNRISAVSSHNRQDMDRVLRSLAGRIGFHYLEGFSDRVIFKELFLSGMTLLDLKENRMPLSLSHIAARRELTFLVECIERLLHNKVRVASV